MKPKIHTIYQIEGFPGITPRQPMRCWSSWDTFYITRKLAKAGLAKLIKRGEIDANTSTKPKIVPRRLVIA